MKSSSIVSCGLDNTSFDSMAEQSGWGRWVGLTHWRFPRVLNRVLYHREWRSRDKIIQCLCDDIFQQIIINGSHEVFGFLLSVMGFSVNFIDN